MHIRIDAQELSLFCFVFFLLANVITLAIQQTLAGENNVWVINEARKKYYRWALFHVNYQQ